MYLKAVKYLNRSTVLCYKNRMMVALEWKTFDLMEKLSDIFNAEVYEHRKMV